MKATVEKIIYETVDIDDKFAPLLEKSVNDELEYTDEEEELWDELIRLAVNNGWYAGFSADKDKDLYWEI